MLSRALSSIQKKKKNNNNNNRLGNEGVHADSVNRFRALVLRPGK